jgi:hypothetical protein
LSGDLDSQAKPRLISYVAWLQRTLNLGSTMKVSNERMSEKGRIREGQAFSTDARYDAKARPETTELCDDWR